MRNNPERSPDTTKERAIYSVDHGVHHTRYVDKDGKLLRETFGVAPRQYVYRNGICLGVRGHHCQPMPGDTVTDD